MWIELHNGDVERIKAEFRSPVLSNVWSVGTVSRAITAAEAGKKTRPEAVVARLEEEVHHLLNENSRLESLLSAYRTVHEEAKEEGRPS